MTIQIAYHQDLGWCCSVHDYYGLIAVGWSYISDIAAVEEAMKLESQFIWE